MERARNTDPILLQKIRQRQIKRAIKIIQSPAKVRKGKSKKISVL